MHLIINEGQARKTALNRHVDIVALALSANERAVARVLWTAPLVPTARVMIVIRLMLVTGTFGALAGVSDDARRAQRREGKHRPNDCPIGHLPNHIIQNLFGPPTYVKVVASRYGNSIRALALTDLRV